MNRFEWLKAVMRADLPDRAKSVATALALVFCNDETGQINPGYGAIADAIGGAHHDTIKRAVAALSEAGWLALPEGRKAGRGRGNAVSYILTSPGKVVPMHRPKRPDQGTEAGTKTLQSCGVKPEKKPRNPAAKTPQSCNPHIRMEQSLEQKAGETRTDDRWPVGQCVLIEPGSRHFEEWMAWLPRHGWPDLPALGPRVRCREQDGWLLPFRLPPSDDDDIKIRITERVLSWAMHDAAIEQAELRA